MSYSLDQDDKGYSELFLHNLASTPQPNSSAKGYIRAIDRYLDETDEHDLNERDAYGRTALHVAVHHRNVDAVVALLMCGADVNAADRAGKSPFSYLLKSYEAKSYKANQLFFTLHGHVHKLLALGLEVSEENRRCYGLARARHVFNDKQLQNGYALELDKMRDVIVARDATLRDVLFGSAQALATSTRKRQTLEDVLTSSDFCDEFPKLCCLVMLQYRRGLARRKMLQPAKAALEDVLGLSLPDPCSESIIGHLSDDDVMSLIGARTEDA